MQLKGNQGDIQADMRAFVADQDIEYIDEYTSVDGDHGRVEARSYRVYDVPDCLTETHQWPHLGAFVHVVSKRTAGQTARHSERLYLLSKWVTAQAAATLIRGHWEIENSLHWSLDVAMNDDQHRAREDKAPANFAALRADRIGHHQGEYRKRLKPRKVQKGRLEQWLSAYTHQRLLKRDCPGRSALQS